jgi:dihydrofolate synthase / folylpolyglutamate synthase
VVGTNGKSSVTLMTAALLEEHGLATGAYLSPHIGRWAERIRIGGEPISTPAFADAIERTGQAVEAVSRSLDDGDPVTQFEAATAAAFAAFAAAGIEVAVVEAGLGGRLDATNVIPSAVTVLTSVSLDHTELLGDSELEIAAEKLAVLNDHSTLVIGSVSDEVARLARGVAEEQNARLIVAPAEPPGKVELQARGPYQRRNFALACAAVEAFLGRLDEAAAAKVGAELLIPGRLELLEGDPPLVLDAAHNPEGAAAVAEALPEIAEGRPVVACVALLAEKDAAAVLAALVDVCDAFVCTELSADMLRGKGRPGAEAMATERLAAIARDSGASVVEAVADPGMALDRARELTSERGGIVLVAGSHYLLEQVHEWTERHALN